MTRVAAALAALVAIIALVGLGAWYVGVYDTAEARCERGDLDACTVLRQQAEARAQAEADAWAAEAAAAAAEAAALEDERGRVGRCFLQLTDHNATVRVSGDGAADTCALFRDSLDGWAPASGEPTGVRVICTLPYGGLNGAEQTLTVLDTGGATYGTDLCGQLQAGY